MNKLCRLVLVTKIYKKYKKNPPKNHNERASIMSLVSELEEEEPIINWHTEVTERLGSRLYALWNRTQGDCLLDSVLQASWGVFDRDNTLRRALADSLTDAQHM